MTRESIPYELSVVLGHYALGELRTVRRAERGFVNDNWIVTTDRGRYFVKRRHPDLRRPDVIRAQHELLRWLRRMAFPAPLVVPTLQGQTLLMLGGQCYEIQGFIDGDPYDHDRSTHLEEAAVTLGHYHTYVQGFSPPALRGLVELYSPAILQSVLTALITAWELDQDSDLAPSIRRLRIHTDELAERFAGHGALPCLVIHGDYYAGNLLFDGDRIIGVVDYDKARWQPRIVELAEALIYFSSPRPGNLQHLVYPGVLDWERFAHFWRNYARVVALKKGEGRALPDYVRCIWLQMSLTRLLEKGSRPPEAYAALQEVLVLANWARANTQPMVEVGRSVKNERRL